MHLHWLLVLALASLSSVGSWLHPSSQILVPLSRAGGGSVLACAVIMKNFNPAPIWSRSSTQAVSPALLSDPLVTGGWLVAPFACPCIARACFYPLSHSSLILL